MLLNSNSVQLQVKQLGQYFSSLALQRRLVFITANSVVALATVVTNAVASAYPATQVPW